MICPFVPLTRLINTTQWDKKIFWIFGAFLCYLIAFSFDLWNGIRMLTPAPASSEAGDSSSAGGRSSSSELL